MTTSREIRRELNEALALLRKIFNFEFPRPTLYIGDKYSSQLIEINSLKDMARSSLVLMVYDDEKNGIFVSDRLLKDESIQDEGKFFCFLHEGVHAFLSHQNPQLREKAIEILIKSARKIDKKRGYIYNAFHEGLATYVAVRCLEKTGNQLLVEQARKIHENLTRQWKEWQSSKEFTFMTTAMYKLKAGETQKALLQYF